MSIPRDQQTSRRHPCPVCGKADWCFFSEDGTFVFCHRVSDGSIRTARNGAYIHALDALSTYKPIHAKPKREKPQCEKASAEHLDKVYSAMLELLTLEVRHSSDLLRRGLSHHAIIENSYKSTPTLFNASQIAIELSHSFNLSGVPGFFQDRGTWQMVKMREGFLVPYRNTQGQIHGLQYRLDQPIDGKQKYFWLSSFRFYKGTSSGSPVHFMKSNSIKDEVLIIEGALKADVVSYLTSQPVIAAAGVSNFGAMFAFHLRKRFPHLRKVVLCFDSDKYDKEQVRSHMLKLGHELRRAFFDVSVRDWSEEFKGYDDFLVAQTNKTSEVQDDNKCKTSD